MVVAAKDELVDCRFDEEWVFVVFVEISAPIIAAAINGDFVHLLQSKWSVACTVKIYDRKLHFSF